MPISVKFFARLRETLQRDGATLDYSPGMTVTQVWQQVSGGIDMPDNTLMAVNMEYVTRTQAVRDGDEVAFFPPVTGG